MRYDDEYVKEIKEDKEKLINLLEKSYDIEKRNNEESQKTIRCITAMFLFLVLLTCILFVVLDSKIKKDIINTNTNTNTLKQPVKGGNYRNGG